MTAPIYRSRCQLSGAAAETCAAAVEVEALRASMTAAVGVYDCPCGSTFEFWEASSLEDYAALNRWLGRHTPACSDVVLADADVLRRDRARLQGEIDQLRGRRGW